MDLEIGAGLANCSGLYIVVDVGKILLEVVCKHLHQLGRLTIIGCGIIPRAAGVQKNLCNAVCFYGHVKPKVCILAEIYF